MKHKAFSLSLLAAVLALAGCGGDGISSSTSEPSSSDLTSSLPPDTSSNSSATSSTPIEETWDELFLTEMRLALCGYTLPYIDLSGYTWDFIEYSGGLYSLEVENAPFSLVEEYAAILAESGLERLEGTESYEYNYEFMYEGAHLYLQLYLADETYNTIGEGTGVMCVDAMAREAVTEYPADTIAALVAALAGDAEVNFPDLSAYPSGDYYIYDGTSTEGLFQIQWTGIEDTVTPADLAPAFTAAGWTLSDDSTYLDPTGTLIAIIAQDIDDGTTFVHVELAPLTSVPNDELSEYFGLTIDLPDYPGDATYEIVDYSIFGIYYLSVVPVETASLDAWIAVFVAEGWTENGAASDGSPYLLSPDATYQVSLTLDTSYGEIIVQFLQPQINYDAYPAAEVAELVTALGATGVTLPDLSSVTTEGGIVIADMIDEGGYFQLIWSALDGDKTEEIAAIYEEAGWTYRATEGAYVDPTGTVSVIPAYVMDSNYDYVTLIQVSLAGEAPSAAWPEDGFAEEIASLGLSGSLPAIEGASINEVSAEVDDYNGTLSIAVATVTEEEVAAYASVLLEAGFEAITLGSSSLSNVFTVYGDTENNLGVELIYQDGVLYISVLDLAWNLLYDADYLSTIIEYMGATVTLPSTSLEGTYCYIDTSMLDYGYAMAIMTIAGGDYTEAVTTELTANGWVVDPTSFEGSTSLLYGTTEEYTCVFSLSYDATNNITEILIQVPGAY